MKDEFLILRPMILLSTGFLVLNIVLHACREAAEQRARFSRHPPALAQSAETASGPAMKSAAAFRVFPPGSLPAGTLEMAVPAAD